VYGAHEEKAGRKGCSRYPRSSRNAVRRGRFRGSAPANRAAVNARRTGADSAAASPRERPAGTPGSGGRDYPRTVNDCFIFALELSPA
jgi:hypothetical protein